MHAFAVRHLNRERPSNTAPCNGPNHRISMLPWQTGMARPLLLTRLPAPRSLPATCKLHRNRRPAVRLSCAAHRVWVAYRYEPLKYCWSIKGLHALTIRSIHNRRPDLRRVSKASTPKRGGLGITPKGVIYYQGYTHLIRLHASMTSRQYFSGGLIQNCHLCKLDTHSLRKLKGKSLLLSIMQTQTGRAFAL